MRWVAISEAFPELPLARTQNFTMNGLPSLSLRLSKGGPTLLLGGAHALAGRRAHLANWTTGGLRSSWRAATPTRGTKTFKGNNGSVDASALFLESYHYVCYVHSILS